MDALSMGKILCCIIFSACLTQCATSPSPLLQKELAYGTEALDQGKNGEAITHLTAYLAKVPGDADAHLKLGCALLKNEQLHEAVAHFKEAITLDPQNEQSKQLIKNSIFAESLKFSEKNKLDIATRYLMGYLTINPDDIDTHIRLARNFIKMGDRRDAIASVTHAASLDPRNPEVVELLDYFSSGFH
jgi:cytochrome c-type biogenesis protein CcmH/NrfG